MPLGELTRGDRRVLLTLLSAVAVAAACLMAWRAG